MESSNKTEALNPIVLISSLNDTVTKPQLIDRHLKELVEGSGINSEIAATAFESVETSQELLNRKDDPGAGWKAIAVDPLTGKTDDTLVNFKPDKKQSNVKYLNKTGGRRDAICLQMPDVNYWSNVGADVKQPILLPEGTKKAAAILSQGYAAIALPSITDFKQKGTDKPHSNTLAFLQPGRDVYLVPDADFKTNKTVALSVLGHIKCLLQYRVNVKVLEWNTSIGKGIDDVIVKEGGGVVAELMKTALTIEEFKILLAAFEAENSFNEAEESLEDAVSRVIAKEHPDTYFKTPYEWYVRRDGTQLKPAKDSEIKMMIRGILRGLVRYSAKGDARRGLATNHNVNECFKLFQAEAEAQTKFKSEPNKKFFVNGIFCTDTDTFRTYQKEDISLVNLPYSYIEGADCPDVIYSIWQEKFGDIRLNAVEQKEQLQALVRFYLDFPQNQGWNWFVSVIGKSETGKGVFCSIIASLYESINIAPIGDIADLSDVKESYNYIKETKCLCIGEEIDSYIKKTGGLYSLVTGKKVASRKLNHNTTEEGVESNVKFLFASTAALGASMTSNEGFSRRLITLKTNGEVGECSVGFIDFNKYAGQLASWALQMPRAKVKETLLKLQRLNADESDLSSNAINRFVAQCFIRANDEEGKHSEKQFVEQKEMLKCFKAWADYEGVSKLGGSKFYERLNEALGTLFRPIGKVEKVNGKSIRPLKNRYIGLQKSPFLLVNDDNDNIPTTINDDALIEGQTLRDLTKPIGDPEPKPVSYEQQTIEPVVNYAPQTTNPNEPAF